MSSSRAARVIAGLGVTGVLAASGLVLAGPANAADDAVSASATYNCTVTPGSPAAPVAVNFSIPAAAFPAGSVPVGSKIGDIPVTATADIPSTLVDAVISGLALVGSSPSASGLPVPSSLAGTISGDSALGGQALPTSLNVATPLTPLLTGLLPQLAAIPGLGAVIQPLLAPFMSGTATLGNLSNLLGNVDPTTLAQLITAGLPASGLPLTDGTDAASPSMHGTIKSFTVKKVGAQSFTLPKAISADLLAGVLPGAPCTYASGTQKVGTINVAKDASAIKSAKVAGSKLKVAVANASGTALKPTGTVAAFAGSKKVGSGSLKKGVATFGLKGLKHGANKLTLKYAGSSLFTAAKSKSVTVAGR